MYEYSKMSQKERRSIVEKRRTLGFPLHAPPHLSREAGEYLITSACYQHRRMFKSPESLTWLCERALRIFAEANLGIRAWVFLPNHYHVLLCLADMRILSEVLRKFHSGVASAINRKEQLPGRKVWYRFSDRKIRSHRHLVATINYIHYNPVKHGYVEDMDRWPWSSWHEYVQRLGYDAMLEGMRKYPLWDYGKEWDQ